MEHLNEIISRAMAGNRHPVPRGWITSVEEKRILDGLPGRNEREREHADRIEARKASAEPREGVVQKAGGRES